MECTLCPRRCRAYRDNGARGFCGETSQLSAARASLHLWEEPCISGTRGSGAVFFSGCVLRCVFCQNYDISSRGVGKSLTEERLCGIFLELQAQGAHNINLVNATHFTPQVIRALEAAKKRGLSLPVVWNSGGYELPETLKMLEGLVDIYLPDVKYYSDELSQRLSSAPGYFSTAMAAVDEMLRQTGAPEFSPEGLLLKGTVVRHLVLPWEYRDSIEVIKRLGERFGGQILFSLMSQYTPFGRVKTDPSLSRMNRRITTFEYQKALDAVIEAGLTGYMQEKSSAREEYTPSFDFTGI